MSRKIAHSSVLFLVIPLVLSGFTHLWNPVGFPSIYIDENTYLRRAVDVLQGNGPIDKTSVYPPYDHPFFGQIFLASTFRIIGFPDHLINQIALGDEHSIEMLYLIPRVVMGVLAILGTFLVYQISEKLYNNRKVAFIASILFAVMPMTWLLRMVMLESIQLPFILLAILSAIYIKKDGSNKHRQNNITVALTSGILVGLAILTKMSAITIIPLCFYLVYSNSKNLKIMGLWFIPVIFIPTIWPIYAFSVGDFNLWLDGIYLQTHRDDPAYNPVPLSASIKHLLVIDPILMILGIASIVFAAIKRDFFILIWSVPLIVFFYFIHSQFFILTPIFPVFCIGVARMISYFSNLIGSRKNIQKTILFTTISGIGLFGLISVTYLLTTNVNSAYIEAVAFVIKFLSSSENDTARSNGENQSPSYGGKMGIVSEDRYYWIPQKILHEDHYYKLWDGVHFLESEQTKNVLLIIDDPVKYWLTSNSTDRNNKNVINLQTIYDNTFPVAEFNKNEDSSNSAGDWNPSKIQIRTNRTSDLLLNSSAFVHDIRSNTIVENETQLHIIMPSSKDLHHFFWDDSLGNCDVLFKCSANVTIGIRDNEIFQIYTNNTIKNSWSWTYGKEIDVSAGEGYSMITHMKLNQYVTQSHIKLEGYNSTSENWYEIIQCPSGTNGPLEWKKFRCDVTISMNTTKVRPVLNAGWSTQDGKEAITLFDAISLNKTLSPNPTGNNVK